MRTALDRMGRKPKMSKTSETRNDHCRGEEANGAVYQDRRGVTADAERDGAVSAAGGRRGTVRVCAGQQSGGRQFALDRGRTCSDVTRERFQAIVSSQAVGDRCLCGLLSSPATQVA